MHDSLTIEKLMQPSGRLQEITSSTSGAAVHDAENDIAEESCCRISRRPTMMIAFRKCSGEVEVLPYSMLTRITSDDTETGFTLIFNTTEIQVTGTNLLRLFHYLCEQRVMELRECSRGEALLECIASEATVARIEFQSQ